jgi:hypothetical protein
MRVYSCWAKTGAQESSQFVLRHAGTKLAHQIEAVVGKEARLLQDDTQKSCARRGPKHTLSALLIRPSLAAATSLLRAGSLSIVM